jgi:outer membrane protein TolC
VAAARDAVGVLERALARADASLADVRARVNTGLLPPNDLLSSQAERARERVSLIQAQNDAALAEARLDRLVGLEPGTPIVTSTPVDRETPGAAAVAAEPLATLVARARVLRPERQAIEAREAGQRAAGAAALAGLRPQVAALAAVEPARPNTRFFPRADDWHTSWDLGVNVTWPLWDGGRARADHATSVAQASATHYELEDFDDALAVEIRQRVLDVQSARAALDASADAVTAATEARRVVGERFDVGVATNTDRLEAEVAEREAELERTRLAAALRVAEARLLRAVGAQP